MLDIVDARCDHETMTLFKIILFISSSVKVLYTGQNPCAHLVILMSEFKAGLLNFEGKLIIRIYSAVT